MHLDEQNPADTNEVEAPESPPVKVGRRNNSGDQKRIQEVHDHSVSLGAACAAEHGTKKDGEIVLDGAVTRLASGEFVKAMSISEQVDSVREAAYRLRDITAKKLRDAKRTSDGLGVDDYIDIPWELLPQCVDVYDSYVVIREGIAHYKVTYTLTDTGVEFADRASWSPVEGAWIAKSAPELFYGQPSTMVKTLTTDASRLGAYLILWGDDKRRDVYGEFFSRRTAEIDSIFKAVGKLPALYQHAMDGNLKSSVIGMIDTLRTDDVGVWMEVQLDLANQYAGAIQKLARKGVLGTSSGTLPGARKVSPDGEILRWPVIEGSLTPTPAEPRMRSERPVAEMKAIYDQVGLELPIPQDATDDTGDEESRQPSEQETALEQLRLLELELSISTE